MEKFLTVSQLNSYIKGVFEDEIILQKINVAGEILECKVTSGNTYIVLKEGDAILNCVSFSELNDCQVGQQVCVNGSVRFHHKSGKMSFIIASVRLVGQGELLAALNQIKEKLAKEGVFSNERTLPSLVTRVALITSAEGAVLHDFMQATGALSYLRVVVFAAKMQGDGASTEIISAMSDINSAKLGSFDVIVLARGGGSATDLGEFNSEPLARKVHESVIPVISAVGHEVDFTLCDFAADIRASTPTKAAELIVANNSRYFVRLFNALNVIKTQTSRLLDWRLGRLSAFAEKISDFVAFKNQKRFNKSSYLSIKIHHRLEVLLEKNCNKLSRCGREIGANIANNLQINVNKINVLAASIKELDPRKILSKGYAKIYKNKNEVASLQQLSSGDTVEIVMSDGAIWAKIE